MQQHQFENWNVKEVDDIRRTTQVLNSIWPLPHTRWCCPCDSPTEIMYDQSH